MYKTKLQELCHQKRWSLPKYSTMKDGPDDDPRFKSCVTVNGVSFHSSVSCKSSKTSQNDAAEHAFLHFTSPNCLISNAENTAGEVKTAESETCEAPEIHGKALGVKNGDEYDIFCDHPYILYLDVRCPYKSLLQNYARHRNLDLPLYSSVKEGPAHAPCYKARVTVNGCTFESVDFFKTLKQAEHAAAKLALHSLEWDAFQEHDGVFYKALLHEISLKESLLVPVYETIKYGAPHMPIFISLVEIDGEVFYGKAGRTKKEAEMKAAKVAYAALVERAQSSSILPKSTTTRKDGNPNSTVVTVDSQNLTPKSMPVSYFLFEHEECTKEFEEHSAELEPANKTASSDNSSSSATVPSMDNFHATGPCLPVPASHRGLSSSSPPMTELDVLALSVSDSTAAMRATETSSYLLCNRVRVYTCFPDITFPEGVTVMPISEGKWVAVGLEFPNEEGN